MNQFLITSLFIFALLSFANLQELYADGPGTVKSIPGETKALKIWTLIKAGSFQMGSPDDEEGHLNNESPVHKVKISRSFYIKTTEVTQGEWRALMGSNPSLFTECGDDCPVERVSWWESLEYCNALSRSENLEECYELSGCSGTLGGGCSQNSGCHGDYQCGRIKFKGPDCKGYRLPTEAEWEYAARAGTSGKNYSDKLDDIAWYEGNSSKTTHLVGQKLPNAWSLYDMSGNVHEWTWDWYEENYYSNKNLNTDPVGPEKGKYHIMRGGSWSYSARYCRLATRISGGSGTRYDFVGLRPVRSFEH